jgi:riboflavin synthase
MWVKIPTRLTPMMVEKGSIAVDGVSLTIVEIKRNAFSVWLIPHTLRNTTLGFKLPRDRVNIEVDIIAKYLKRFYYST